MLQSVQFNEQDGALGVLPDGTRAPAFVGVADSGPLNTPVALARIKDVVAMFTAGPMVEAACAWIQKYKRPALLVRTGNTTAGTVGSVDQTLKTGTSVVTAGADTTPNDDLQGYFRVVKGGTIGTAGITYVWSLSNGREVSEEIALGVANTFVFPGSGGAGLAFAAGTLVAGDILRIPLNAPNWSTAELGTALLSLKGTSIPWEIALVFGPCDATALAAIATALGSLPDKIVLCHLRMPNAGESEATYKTACDAIVSAFGNTSMAATGGATKSTSGISFRSYRRPYLFDAGLRVASVEEHIDASQIDLGPLPGCSIRDANGNVDEHDESLNPGLDDSRLMVAVTHDEEQGVYINNPKLLSPAGSDFKYIQHRRVMNRAKRVLRRFMKRKLSKEIFVDKNTGFILESEALEMEGAATRVADADLKGKVSEIKLVLHRTDNLLSTETLSGQIHLTPLAYPKTIILEIGFRNPALQIVKV